MYCVAVLDVRHELFFISYLFLWYTLKQALGCCWLGDGNDIQPVKVLL